MAAVEAWRSRVRERAHEAADHCRRAYIRLVNSGLVLDRPMRAADRAGGRAQAMVAEDLLLEASNCLAVAVSLLVAAEQVGLCGASPDPAAPLLSFDDIADHTEPDRNMRAALEQLCDARVGADSAWVTVQRSRGHLRAASLLLDHERLPGVDGFLDNERAAARIVLDGAWGLALQSAKLARAPSQAVGYLVPTD